MSVTLHFQSTGSVPGNARPVAMVGRSLTVGREPDNSLMLPDPSKMVSRYHCAIEDHGGNIVVIDLSANGTFLNYGKVPLGRVPTPLNDGDILSIGSFELMVELTGQRAAAPATDLPPLPDPALASPGAVMPAPSDLHDDGSDILAEILGDGASLTGPGSVQRPQLGEDGLLPPLGEDDPLGPSPAAPAGPAIPEHAPPEQEHFRPPGPTQFIPEDWGDDFDSLLGDTDPFGKPDEPAPVPPSAEEAPPAAPVLPPQGGEEAAARAFLTALGAEELRVPDQELTATMTRLGQVLRTMLEGVREILMTRTTIKDEFGIRQTIIGATGNNPLKFSIDPGQAIEAMVRPSRAGYLDAATAAEQALFDIKAHEVAVISGMEAAVKGVLRQLAPETLEAQMEGKGGGFLKGRKARYWETYEKMYAQISDQAEKDFHDLFSREFARAYQAQLERLK